HARAELPARDAWLRHLENGAADLPALSHDRAGHVHAGHRQVLAEDAVLQLAAELPFPPDRVLACVGVHRLVRASMELAVGLVVSGDVYSAHRQCAVERRLSTR